jgi:hypothetical protein
VGAVVGSIDAPTAIVAGLYQNNGTLRMVGRSVSLTRTQSVALAAALTPADEGHSWPDTIAATRFGGGEDRVLLIKVRPGIVTEVAADAARQHGVWRHGLRFVRLRPDMTVDELPTRASIPPERYGRGPPVCPERISAQLVRGNGQLRMVRLPHRGTVVLGGWLGRSDGCVGA